MTPFTLTTALLVLVAALSAGPPAAWVVRAYAEDRAAPGSRTLAAVAAGLFAWAALMIPLGWVLAASLALGWALLCLAVIDIIALRLPDPLTLPLAVAGLVVAAFLPGAPILGHLIG